MNIGSIKPCLYFSFLNMTQNFVSNMDIVKDNKNRFVQEPVLKW